MFGFFRLSLGTSPLPSPRKCSSDVKTTWCRVFVNDIKTIIDWDSLPRYPGVLCEDDDMRSTSVVGGREGYKRRPEWVSFFLFPQGHLQSLSGPSRGSLLKHGFSRVGDAEKEEGLSWVSTQPRILLNGWWREGGPGGNLRTWHWPRSSCTRILVRHVVPGTDSLIMCPRVPKRTEAPLNVWI